MSNTPKRKKPNTPSSPPKTPAKSAKRSPSPPPRSATPKTKAVENAFSRLTTAVSSPNRRKKAVRRALNFAENTIASSAKAAQNAMRRAQLAKSIKTPFQIRNELQNKTSKNKNTGKR
jgi:hypothetical protein